MKFLLDIKKIKYLFTSKKFWINILSGLVLSGIIWILTLFTGLLKGLDLMASLKWTLEILNTKINLIYLFIFFITVFIYINWKTKQLMQHFEEKYFSKDEMNKKLEKKLDKSQFENFEDIFDYRRLINHPWHDMYVNKNDDISSFKSMVYFGITKCDPYKIDNGIQGLIKELKGLDSITSELKTELTNLLKDCYPKEYNSHKEELIKLLNEIITY